MVELIYIEKEDRSSLYKYTNKELSIIAILENTSIYHILEKYFLLKLWYDNDDDYHD